MEAKGRHSRGIESLNMPHETVPSGTSASQSLILSSTIRLYSRGEFYSENITERVRGLVKSSGTYTGRVMISVLHTTSAVFIIEHESGVLCDIRTCLRSVTSPANGFVHHRRNVDNNGRGHVLSALLSGSLSIPVFQHDTVLGEYQDIVFIDFQPHIRVRDVHVQIEGIEK